MIWCGKSPYLSTKVFFSEASVNDPSHSHKKRYYRLGGNTSDTPNPWHKDMAKIWISGFTGSLTDCISPQHGKHNIFSNSLPLYPL